MNTDARELSADEVNELDGWARDFDRKNGISPKEYLQYLRGRASAKQIGHVFNGSTKFISWMLGINAVLVAAAILGGINFAVQFSGRMSAVEARMEIVMVRLK